MKKVGIIFGGMSSEHDVSIMSGKSVIDSINKEKYEVYPIYIDQNGIWYEGVDNRNKIDNFMEYLKKMDVVFPVMHGKYGEDGTIQGLLEIIKVPYVGCGVLASSIGMDKVYTKIVFEKAGLKQAPYCVYTGDNINEIEEKLNYPMFVKPSNSGSSIGITKVKNRKELEDAISYAKKFDKKVLVEEGIVGKEIECAVLGNEDAKASCTGQIIPAEEFYSYDAKYNNIESKLIIPSGIKEEDEVRKQAIKAFKAIDGRGLSRVDFFVTNEGEIYINEINTMPGFTNISMYSKLWDKSGVEFEDLIDKLIELAL